MSHIYYTEQVHNYHKVQDFRGNLTAASGTVLSMISQVRSPKLTVVFSQSPYMLMAYRVVGAGASHKRNTWWAWSGRALPHRRVCQS